MKKGCFVCRGKGRLFHFRRYQHETWLCWDCIEKMVWLLVDNDRLYELIRGELK